MKNIGLFLILLSAGACVSFQKESAKEDLSGEGSPFAGNWISRNYAEALTASQSPYDACKKAPYKHLIVRSKGTDTLLIRQINYEDSEDTPQMMFVKEGSLYQQTGTYPLGCNDCPILACGKDCQTLKIRVKGESNYLQLDKQEFARIPDLCPNPDEVWWFCMDFWVNELVIVGEYGLVNLNDSTKLDVTFLANNQVIGWRNHSTYSLWNWFLQEQSAYPFDVLQLTTDDYQEDQFDFANAFAIEKSGDTLKLFSTEMNREKWIAEKLKMEYLLIKK